MKAVTPSQAQDLARNLGTRLMAKDNNNTQEMHNLIAGLNSASLEEEDLAALGSLLALPDAQFALVAPAFLEEMEKTYHITNNQLLMIQVMNATGHTVEEIENEYNTICEVIDGYSDTTLTAPKRDFLKSLLGIVYNSVTGIEGIAKKVVNIPIEMCHPDAQLPVYAHSSDAGMDVYALEEITVNPGETKLIPLGFKVAIPLGYELQVRPKSGRCLKTKLRVANTPGTIDAGYRDEVGIIIENIDPPIRAIHPRTTTLNTDGVASIVKSEPITEGDIEFGQSYTIGKGEKFAQLVLSEVPKACWVEVQSVNFIGEDRGGGFGSTGVK